MRTQRSDSRRRPIAGPRGRRRLALLGAGMLVFVLGTAGVVAAVTGRWSTGAQPPERSITVPDPTVIEGESARHGSVELAIAPSSVPPSPPAALADGTYPTYVRQVDVGGAMITVDVIQTFQEEAAVDAAIEDGVSPEDAQQYLYFPVYVRNVNPLLRTISVATDVGIEFIGECESPGNRQAALQELSERTMTFDPTYYYSITVQGGAVERVVQHIAVPAC